MLRIVDVGKVDEGGGEKRLGGLVLSFKGRSLTPTEARAFVDPVHPEYPARVHLVLRGTGAEYCACHCIRSIFVVVVARVIGTGRGGGGGGSGGSNGGGDDDDGVDEGIIRHHKTLHTRSSEHGHEPYPTCHRYGYCCLDEENPQYKYKAGTNIATTSQADKPTSQQALAGLWTLGSRAVLCVWPQKGAHEMVS